MAICTRPTGWFSLVYGPATPVVEMAQSVANRSRTAAAIKRAVTGDTAPCVAIWSASPPTTALLDPALYAVLPPATVADAPDTSIKVAHSRPPASDSATATVWPASIRARTRPVAVVISHCAGSPARRAHTQARFRP